MLLAHVMTGVGSVVSADMGDTWPLSRWLKSKAVLLSGRAHRDPKVYDVGAMVRAATDRWGGEPTLDNEKVSASA